MHFGRDAPAAERAKEADLIACLQTHAAEAEALYLVGDVFDEYIEYPTLVPKGFVRFQALLAAWTDRGVPVTYLVGNHDPWHRDYFERELGVQVVFDPIRVQHHGRRLFIAHGDGLAPSHRRYRRLKPLLRHPVPVWLYRTLLPGDLGMRLARRVNRRLRRDTIDATSVRELREMARTKLRQSDLDLVVLAHTHQVAQHTWPEGTYVNLGAWSLGRTFARLSNGAITLVRWNGKEALAVDPGS